MRIVRSVLLALALVLSFLPAAQAIDERVIDVAAITWATAAKPSVTLGDIQNSIATEVNSQWISFTTLRGEEKSSAISFVNGKKLDNPLILTAPLSCDRSDFTSFMSAVRAEVYKSLAIENWQERYLAVLTPEAGCVWSGRAQIGEKGKKGGVLFLHDSAEAFVITHELGHSLGLGHTNLMKCPGEKPDGKWGDCRALEYGGAIDVMANVPTNSPLSTYHQWRMGLLATEQVHQSWVNESISLSASDYAKGIRALFFRDGASSYWIEYRRAQPERSINAGLVIYRTDPPPVSAIISPNPEDLDGAESGTGVGTDIWMLNLDNFNYAGSKSSGSMTLPANKKFSTSSNRITLEVSPTDSSDQIKLTITQVADKNPPPKPILTLNTGWRYPSAEILATEYDDKESAVDFFEIDIDGKISKLPSVSEATWFPTYLNPINPPKTIRISDLPEGSYSFAIRAVDMWGNRSDWSAKTKITVDRNQPEISSEISISALKKNELTLRFDGTKDLGAGLCRTIITSPSGWVSHQSNELSAPNLLFELNSKTVGNLQAYDCLGNGLTRPISISNLLVSTSAVSKTGKWTPVLQDGIEGLKCAKKCSISYSGAGKIAALIGSGSVDITSSGKSLTKVDSATSRIIRASKIIDIGNLKRVVRVVGSDFSFFGFITLKTEFGIAQPREAKPLVSDPSLKVPEQIEMAKFGFRLDDFDQDWIVLPIGNGTTLLDPSLDLCSSTYLSEAGRQSRRQVAVTKANSPFIFLSTEVVRYKSISAASLAYKELLENYEACKKNRGGIEKGGDFTEYKFQALTPALEFKSRELWKDSVVVHAVIGSGVSSRTLFGVYQFRDQLLIGLYVVKTGSSYFTDAEQAEWLSVARTLANRG